MHVSNWMTNDHVETWCHDLHEGKCQEVPPQEVLLGGTSWGGTFWVNRSSGSPTSIIMYFLHCFRSLSRIILGPQVTKKVAQIEWRGGKCMRVISAIWQMYFGQKQSRLIKSSKNVRRTLSAVEWLHENWVNWLLLTRILNPILMHMLGNTQNLYSTKTSNQIKICRVWKICKTKPTQPNLQIHLCLFSLIA